MTRSVASEAVLVTSMRTRKLGSVIDGSARLPITFPRGVGTAQGQTQIALTFPTPLRFTTDVNCRVVTGTLVYSITVIGYEVALP